MATGNGKTSRFMPRKRTTTNEFILGAMDKLQNAVDESWCGHFLNAGFDISDDAYSAFSSRGRRDNFDVDFPAKQV